MTFLELALSSASGRAGVMRRLSPPSQESQSMCPGQGLNSGTPIVGYPSRVRHSGGESACGSCGTQGAALGRLLPPKSTAAGARGLLAPMYAGRMVLHRRDCGQDRPRVCAFSVRAALSSAARQHDDNPLLAAVSMFALVWLRQTAKLRTSQPWREHGIIRTGETGDHRSASFVPVTRRLALTE